MVPSLPSALSLPSAWVDPSGMLGQLGPWVLAVSAAMVFLECGALLAFLPGDSLLFGIGMVDRAAQTGGGPGVSVSLPVVVLVLSAAAVLGNLVGYELCRRAGPWLVRRGGRVLRAEHVDRTSAFLRRHGVAALVLARFVPVLRTLVSVVAGAAGMRRRTFLWGSVAGALVWTVSLTGAGYLLGTVGFLQRHVELVVVLAVVTLLLPVLPGVLTALEERRRVASTPAAQRGDAARGRRSGPTGQATQAAGRRLPVTGPADA